MALETNRTTMNNNHKSVLVFFFFFMAMAATALARKATNTSAFDEVMKQRYEQALKDSKMAYNPNPQDVTSSFTEEVGHSLRDVSKGKHKHQNDTRRQLAGEECLALNPIDSCWRCKADWAKDRMSLAHCARGFAHNVTGGLGGKIYVVTDPSDDDMLNPKPGTLRHAVIQKEPLWIIFDRSMVITLKQELIFTSNKTIDGRGAEVRIAKGAGFTLQFISNVIIHGIRIHDIKPRNGGMIRDSVDHYGLRTESDGDAINIFCSNTIWIDHVSLARCQDGLIDAIMASTAITISNCKFNQHNDVMLLGGHDGYSQDSLMQVTVAFNRFGKGLIQRMPRCRWGFFHIVNNDYNRWEMYAIGGSSHPTIISQGNRFKASDSLYTKEVTKRDLASKSEWMKWQWVSVDDVFQNGAFFVSSGPELVTDKRLNSQTSVAHKHGKYVAQLTRNAGALMCSVGKPC